MSTTADMLAPLVAPPPLQSGDHLSRVEFERRYEQMPPHIKAELIEGVVYLPSPVRIGSHGRPHAILMTWLGVYWMATPGVEVADNTTVRLDLDNEVQPDALLRIDEAHGGQSRIGPDDYLQGAPELIVEIAASTAAYDLHDKLNVYRRNGVQEYLVWSMYPRQFQWFRLRDGVYRPLVPSDDTGLMRSELFPGLQMPVAALLAEDHPALLRAVEEGIRTAEHAAFVQQLAARSPRS